MLFVLLITVIVLNPACKKEDGNPNLPDLIVGNLTAPGDVVVGQAFPIEVEILNLPASSGSTLDAGPSEYALRIYQVGPDGQLTPVSELVKPVSEIKAGTKKKNTNYIVINSPGNYLIDVAADVSNFVQERDESNNAKQQMINL